MERTEGCTLKMKVHSSVIHKSEEAETTMNGWRDTHNVSTQTMECYSALTRKTMLLRATAQTKLEDVTLMK